ncbi:WYL domain-containing protein [Streptomyces sp. NPDC029006]|uniref:WYL domain-containing protein n=1 Tax=Streptomyces sp. NPDC029006 TaxID=3155467 RepID=UPI0033DE32B0
MRITAKQTQTKTLTDLYRAIDRQHAVTITYLKPGETEPTVRTIEISDLRTVALKVAKKTGEISGGGIVVLAMCRLRGEAREFHLSGILAYTVHRMGYVLTPPANTTYEPTPQAPADDETALIFFELERDPDDADYRPRRKLTQSQTDLAA